MSVIHSIAKEILSSKGSISTIEQLKAAYPDANIAQLKEALALASNTKEEPSIPAEVLAAATVKAGPKAEAGVTHGETAAHQEDKEAHLTAQLEKLAEASRNGELNKGKGVA